MVDAMKVFIRRTSQSSLGEDPPCEGAVRVWVPNWDQRTFKTPEEHDARLSHMAPWLSVGSEHGVNKVGIFRKLDLPAHAWVLEIPDLVDFVRVNGRVILDVLDDADRMHDIEGVECSVEIYDDYRE